jgi:hypothetical protein
MGAVYNAYYVAAGGVPAAGTNIGLRATLGSKIGISSGSISLSSSFGGRTGPYNYQGG